MCWPYVISGKLWCLNYAEVVSPDKIFICMPRLILRDNNSEKLSSLNFLSNSVVQLFMESPAEYPGITIITAHLYINIMQSGLLLRGEISIINKKTTRMHKKMTIKKAQVEDKQLTTLECNWGRVTICS